MTTQQAISIFDDHLVYLAGRKMINNVMLDKLKTALKVIADAVDSDCTDAINRVSTDDQKLLKMHLLLQCNGLTPKGIEHHLKKPYSYLEKWAELTRRKGITINSEAGASMFEMEERHTRLLAEQDIANVKSYRTWRTMKVGELTRFFRDNYQHLQRWFNDVDAGNEINDREIYNAVYEKHLEGIK